MDSHLTAPLLLTTGEPAGIGPDLCIQLADYLLTQPIVLCGDIDLLRSRAKQHNSDINFHHEDDFSDTRFSLAVRHTPLLAPAQAGKLSMANATYVIDTLTIATQETLSGKYAGIVTAPIHKGIICDASTNNTNFSGHTEFFAEKTQAKCPVMVLGNEQLKVALATTHLPLRSVSEAITENLLTNILTVIHQDMKRFFTNGDIPKIGVCGLNPHAGESAHMGYEETKIINPTLAKLRAMGLKVSDALPADTLFVPHHAAQFDIIVAMYHDQGLPVIKSQSFGECVNMTFGLPIIRTSVDHGTALDLAGTDKANPNSLQCAISMAKRMSGLN
ncbi:MAG: 4-hydroxythreonine-4-phosphate dehydrogenase PdxA [Ostreibacterium sp.]